MDRQTIENMTSAERTEIITQCEALISAARRTQLAAIAVADDLEDWNEDGATSMVAWLRMRLGVFGYTASELVRVAHALEELPKIAQTFDDGRLCFDQVRPATQLATPEGAADGSRAPELDAAIAEDAPGRTATQLCRAALRARRVTAEDSEDAHEARYLSMRWDPEKRALRLKGLLPEETGAAVEKALTRIVDQRLREGDRAKGKGTQAAEDRPSDAEAGPSTERTRPSGEGTGASGEGTGTSDDDPGRLPRSTSSMRTPLWNWRRRGSRTIPTPTGRPSSSTSTPPR